MKDKITSPTLFFVDQKEFEQWLQQHFLSKDGLWIKFAKKNSGIPSINPEQALASALCYGWIDGQRKSFDHQYFLNKYTPRRKSSLWSKRNRDLAERLIETGKMQPKGIQEIELARKDGRWERAYDSPKNMEMPSDFIERVKLSKNAFECYSTLNKTKLFSIAFRLQTAQKPETREKRIIQILNMLENNEFK